MSSEKKINRLDQGQFFRACKALEEMGSTFKAEQTPFPQAARQLSNMVGFAIANDSLRRIREATGINWEAKKPTRKNQNTDRYLAGQIVRIQQELGMTVPDRLADLAEITLPVEKKPLTITNLKGAEDTAKKVFKPDVVPVHVAGK